MGSDHITSESHPQLWERLEKIWQDEGKPGYITVRGAMFRVFLPEGFPVFQRIGGGFDDNYQSVSTGSLVK